MKGSSLVYAISSHKDFVPAPGVQVSRKRHESLVKARKRGMSPHSWIAAEALPFLGDVDEDLSGRYKLQRLELGSRHFGDFFVGIWSPGTGGLVPGDATAHHGWTLHSAAGIPKTAPPRLAWTLGFVADGARLRRGELELGEDAVSYEAWAKELGPGARVEHPMVPLLPAA